MDWNGATLFGGGDGSLCRRRGPLYLRNLPTRLLRQEIWPQSHIERSQKSRNGENGHAPMFTSPRLPSQMRHFQAPDGPFLVVRWE